MLNTKSLFNRRVYVNSTNKCIGRLRTCLFFDMKCVGFVLKRPDILLMFHRSPAFIALQDINIADDNRSVLIPDKSALTSPKVATSKQLGIKLENCEVWADAPVYSGNTKIGIIDNVYFDDKSGSIERVELASGALAGKILGVTSIDVDDILCFSNANNHIVLKENARLKEMGGGVAQKAGQTTSYICHTIKTKTPSVVNKTKKMADSASNYVKEKSPKVIDGIQDQSDKLNSMFRDFKSEFDKGMKGD